VKVIYPSPEFDDMVAAVCHGSATDAEMEALNELLRKDPRAMDEYLWRLELHSRLASDADLFTQSAPQTADYSIPEKSAPAAPDNIVSIGSTPWTPRKAWLTTLALAASLALLAIGIARIWQRPNAPQTGVTSTAVAMLARSVDADWAHAPVREGSALEPGWLRLKSGLAQIIFYSGARVVIEGPAELQLISQSEAACPAGRLLAEVPPPAQGFRLKAGPLDVVDLGTSFGVAATPARTEVHVFAGKVELIADGAWKQSLNENQAAILEGGVISRLEEANPLAFASLFEFQQRSRTSMTLRYEQWQLANAKLNQDPSLIVHLEFQDLDPATWTLRNSAEHNRSVPTATIVGCQRAEGRWPEKHALEFHTVNDRVRMMVPDEFESLTLSLWVCVKGLDRQFNSLVMCDGFEPGTVHWLIRHDGVLGLTVFGPRTGTLQISASPPVLTLDKLGTWLHLVAVVDGQDRQVVQYVNGEPVGRETLKIPPPYRLGPTELGNWNAKSSPLPGPELVRNLSGSVDEFELFNRALNDAEVRELYLKGRPD